MRVVRVFRPQTYLPELAFTVSLLLPTVLLNGALWAQCDSIYGALMLLSTASILEGHPRRSVCLAALAFSFKLQAIFFLPVFALYWMVKRVNLRQLLLFPLTYLITCLPALALGRPLGDILGIYLRQTGRQYPQLQFPLPLFPDRLQRSGRRLERDRYFSGGGHHPGHPGPVLAPAGSAE